MTQFSRMLGSNIIIAAAIKRGVIKKYQLNSCLQLVATIIMHASFHSTKCRFSTPCLLARENYRGNK